jgi:SAM-dependent methyltransferase
VNTSARATPDPFAAVAAFYDLDLEDYDDDLALYARLADAGWRRVLELGCGTGRVAASLAEAGLEVTGVDLSPAMLALAGERTAGRAVRLVEADMRTLDLGERFDAVLVPLGGLQHLETTDDLVAALETIASHLADDGLAVIDVEAPNADDFTPGAQPLVEHWTRVGRVDGADTQVTKLVSVDARPAEGLRDVTWHFDVQPADGALRRVTERFTMRTITAAELDLAARLAGLVVTGEFGGYDLEPYDDTSARLVVTLEHGADEDEAAADDDEGDGA